MGTDERLDRAMLLDARFWRMGVSLMCVLSYLASGCASKAQLAETPPRPLLKGQVLANTETERALAGALVSLLVGTESIMTSTTDAEGHYSFDKIPGSEFDIEVTKKGYGTWRYSVLRQGRLLDPENLSWRDRLINVKLVEPPTVLRGRILSAVTGEGLAGASIWTYPGTVKATADDGGHYMVSSQKFLEAVDYSLCVSCVGHTNFLSSTFQVTTRGTLSLLDVVLMAGKLQDWDMRGVPDYDIYDTGEVIPGSGKAE